MQFISIAIEMSEATTGQAESNNFSYTVTVNDKGVDVKGTSSLTTTWTFPKTVLFPFALNLDRFYSRSTTVAL